MFPLLCRVCILYCRIVHDQTLRIQVHSPKRKLIYRSFLEGVVRLADYKYQDLLTTSQRLSHALFHNILPYACHDHQDNFRNKMEDPACTALVAAYEPHLLVLFKSLCGKEQQTLQLRELLVFLEENKLAKSSEDLNGQMVELYYKSMNGILSSINCSGHRYALLTESRMCRTRAYARVPLFTVLNSYTQYFLTCHDTCRRKIVTGHKPHEYRIRNDLSRVH